ncbi:hypothetical protein CVT24_003738 [Panaeolus cyanescens]|uniref:Uncharacterized protein n=1 Tax=Panaeolus cyanescens TaxID=181874 RepID=A0A409YXL7_9AGAR|nr:hypothetical protein CVT24_003738 [Panaeolus cyanescens]
MRSLLSFALLVVSAACGVSAIASPKQHSSYSLCAPGIEHCSANYRNQERQQNGPTRTVPFARKKLKLTNAERLARGMPLNAPKPHRTVQKRQEPSSFPAAAGVGSITGEDSTPVGYMGATTVDGAIYGTSDQLVNSAIMYVERTGSGNTETRTRITIPDSDVGASFPILGLVQGRDNIDTNVGTGSYHYLYLSGVAQPGTTAGSVSSVVDNTYSDVSGNTRAVQTDVWTVDFTTGVISAVWINDDGTAVPLQFFVQNGAIYATADIAAFVAEYASVTPITLRLVT